MHNRDDEFDSIVSHGFQQPPTEVIDPTPYGYSPQPVKTGLTKRGKAALVFGATVIAGGTLIGYQVHSANAADAQQKAEELAYKRDQLELEKLKELNRVAEQNHKTQVTDSKSRQASINTCVKDKEHLVGKGFGSPSYRDIVDVCQAQYTDTTVTGNDMAAAGSATPTGPGMGGGAGVNNGLLIGGAALGAVVLLAARKGKKSSAE